MTKAGPWEHWPSHRLHVGPWVLSAMLLVCCGDTEDDSPGAVGIDESFLDRSINACDDFYQFACGNWIREHPTDQTPSIERFREGEWRNARLLKQILEEDQAGTPYVPHSQAQLLGNFYAACMTDRSANRAGDRQLTPWLQQIDLLSSLEDLGATLADLHFGGIGAFFHLQAEVDPGNPGRHVATLYAGGLGMPDSGYYLDPTDPVLSEYQEHVRRLSALYPDAASAAIDPAAVVTVETALAQAVLSGPEAADPVATYHLTDLPTVASLLAHFPLEKYLTGALWPSSLSEVNLTDPGYVAGLDTVLLNLPLEALKSYLKWRVLDEYAETLGKAFVEEEARFHYGVFYGDSTPAPDWWGCQQSTVWGLGFALSEPFVSVRLHEPDRASAQALLRQVETAFAGNLAALSWLDEPTRAEAMAKLERVLDLVGYPDQWSSSTTASITRASYFGNVLALVREAKFNNAASLFEPVNRDAWLVPPCVTNAFYAPSHNEMLFPAAILQTPEFDVKGPRALNYGTMGSIMGHELSHGFDHVGRRFDGDGALRDWWTAEVAAEFERRSACLVEQYSKYQALPDLPLNGQLTLGENIADLAGLKLAYTAYRDSGGEKFAGPYGADQQFFLAYAQLWCANFAPELSQTLVRTDPHSPPKYRVNGVVSNLPEFARAFRCAPGSPMAPVDRCELW